MAHGGTFWLLVGTVSRLGFYIKDTEFRVWTAIACQVWHQIRYTRIRHAAKLPSGYDFFGPRLRPDAAVKAVLIFSGYNVRAVLAFLRTLSLNDVPFGILAASADDPVFATDYRDHVLVTRKSTKLDPEAIAVDLNKAIAALPASSYLLAPSTEALNRFALRNRDLFESLNIETMLCSDAIYRQVSDKAAFESLCANAGLATPTRFKSLATATPPFVAKPTHYRGPGSGAILDPAIVTSDAELRRFRRGQPLDDFYYQEYVAGRSFYLLYYFFRDGRQALVYSQENFVQQKQGKSILAAMTSDLHEQAIAAEYSQLFRDLGFTGLVMVELRGAPSELKMIEANPRFWGPSQLFVDAGVNLFAAMLDDYGIKTQFDMPTDTPSATRYFWDDGKAFNADAIADTLFHNYSADALRSDYAEWDSASLYRRADSIAIYRQFVQTSEIARSGKLQQLRKQYGAASKHSNYQILPAKLQQLLPQSELQIQSRHEHARFDYIHKHVELAGKSLLDIGGNTGYFTFEALRAGANVTYYEGNQTHAEFVRTAAELLHVAEQLSIRNRYYRFDDSDTRHFDVVFLLNVLHHVGDDYGDSNLPREEALQSVVDALKFIAERTQTLVFQLGFNWKGDVSQPLFRNGTKREMLSFLQTALDSAYRFEQIGIAVEVAGDVQYQPLDERNIERQDTLGEFLNRPLLILSSRRPM